MGRPVVLLLSEGQMSDDKGARLMVDALPPAKHLLADRGYDADWFREALKDKGYRALYPAKEKSENTDRIRQNSLQATPQSRERVWQTRRLATGRYSI